MIKQNEKVLIAGLAIRTTNENGQSATDIPALWQRFFAEDIMNKLPGKIDNTIYCLYTDYEKDHTRPYTTLLGCRVHEEVNEPGITTKAFTGDKYQVFIAKGAIEDGIVFNEWLKIWNAGIDRLYTTDIEIYGKKAKDKLNAEIPILVAVK
ncbi:MAG: effector binding domain-containing protein [Chitinophagaceae bacterium]|nr:effector binding domain-containing protein [Chitinophagaceae bacterium]